MTDKEKHLPLPAVGEPVELHFPTANMVVDHHVTVTGRTRRDGRLVIFVRATDGKWYSQRPVHVTAGTSWSAGCYVGDEPGHEGEYTIQALLDPVRFSSGDTLPAAEAKSNPVVVFRHPPKGTV